MSGLANNWMTPQEQYGGWMVVFLRWKYQSPVTSIVLDLAATLFTPETPKLFCGLKHFFFPPLHRKSGELILSEFFHFG